MKCESCGNELVGGAIICRACKHNNALRGRTQPRSSRADETRPSASRDTSPLTELPRIAPRKDPDANLIQFPAATRPSANQPTSKPQPELDSQTSTGTEAKNESGAATDPPWRAQLKEKVRQIRERRTGELPAVPPAPTSESDETEVDRNPIVESALKRIQWAAHTPAITTTVGASRQGARAAAAKLTQAQPEAKTAPEPQPEPRAESRVVAPKPSLATGQTANQRTNQTATQPSNRPPASRVETRTLAPKINRDTARPDPKSSPLSESRTLTPRAQPQTTAEPRTERRSESRVEPRTIRRQAATPKSDQYVETQIIEISQLPEQPLPETEPALLSASWWTRTLAGACDFEIIASAYLPVFGAYATLDTSLGGESFLIMLVLLSAVTFVYQLVTLMIAGRTTGMALLNLNLLSAGDDSLPVTRRQKVLRAWAATIAFLLPPLNFVVIRLSAPHRSLPDLISGTTLAKQ